MAEMKLNSQW